MVSYTENTIVMIWRQRIFSAYYIMGVGFWVLEALLHMILFVCLSVCPPGLPSISIPMEYCVVVIIIIIIISPITE